VAKAKELLKKAGYPEGKGLPVINFDMRRSDSTSRQMGEFFTKQFAEIGVKVNMVYNTFPAFLEKQKQGALQMSYGGWQLDYPDVENAYMMFYGPNKSPGANSSFFDHPVYNKLYEKFSTMEPGAARQKLVDEMEEIIQEETPWALGYYRDDYNLYQGWVKNFHYVGFINDKWKYLSLDLEAKKQLKK
jgi:ABC-type transport system substrate-binding protein